jgi:hypothetical protein
MKKLLDKLRAESKKSDSVVKHIEGAKLSVPFSFRAIANKAQEIVTHLKSDKDKDPNYEETFWLLFTELYETTHADKVRVKHKKLYPSYLRDDCHRRIWFYFEDEEVSNPHNGAIEPKLQRIFDVGHFWHNYLQSRLKWAGVLKKSEVQVLSEEYMIRGRADGIVDLNGRDVLLEIKTISGYGFTNLKSPVDSHEFQANIYAEILGLKEILYLYVNKDTCEFKEYLTPVKRKYWLEAKDVIGEIKEKLAQPTPPNRWCKTISDNRATNCEFCDLCFKKYV